MTDAQLVVRVPREVLDRLDALIPVLERDAETRAVGRLTRSSVARLALLRGLAELEAQGAPPGPGPARGR